tara:strand:- start:1823 stop:2689 length:867 start_codon:yes stop_codon:yes gene_type:complete
MSETRKCIVCGQDKKLVKFSKRIHKEKASYGKTCHTCGTLIRRSEILKKIIKCEQCGEEKKINKYQVSHSLLSGGELETKYSPECKECMDRNKRARKSEENFKNSRYSTEKLQLCRRCGKEKGADCFYVDKRRNKNGKPYRKSECIECMKERSRLQWVGGRKDTYSYEYTPSKLNKEINPGALTKKDYQKRMFLAARGRAKSKGLPFTLNEEDVVIPDKCPVFGIDIDVGAAKYAPNIPSIDRVVPELGYTKENIRIVCYRANRLKNNASFEELELIYNWMKKELGKE